MRFGRGGGGGKSSDINLIPPGPDDEPWVRHEEVRLEGRGWFLGGKEAAEPLWLVSPAASETISKGEHRHRHQGRVIVLME
jgi:hypothetical protein